MQADSQKAAHISGTTEPVVQQSKNRSAQLHIDVEALSAAAQDDRDRVCIIGAGKSGLIACKVLHQRGVAFDCFETGSQIGGLWVLNNDSGRSACYDSLCINTSKLMTRFHDFPMPEHYPMYCTHQQILEYLEAYTQHFGFGKSIIFRTEVLSVVPSPTGRFTVLTKDLDTGEVLTRQYGSVINACGHHWDPLWPELKGDYKGELSHAHAYRSPKPFEGKRVCIIGGGNSGMDIASEVAQSGATRTLLSCRRPVHVVPRYIFGKPADAQLKPWLGVTAPRRILEFGVTVMIRLSRGSQKSFNFPPPKFGLLRVHPTVNPGSGDILQLIRDKKVLAKPGIERVDGLTVHFTDGSSEDVDAIICATGYNVKCPFLPTDIRVLKDGKPELMHLVVHPGLPGAYFLGFVQAHGPMIPCVESQVPYVADLIQGVTELPSEEDMWAQIARQHMFNRRSFTQVKRHALMVEFHRYLLQLRLARCPKGKGWLGRKVWKAKTFLDFCSGNTC
ncbi:g6297 [Coccomyxa viridis]|uniref:Flavin-containing monooxygenase n=1 Tax=Coccomyxa viridis TaxID=1274662 RepID=A0ABP1G1L9_9CHLO